MWLVIFDANERFLIGGGGAGGVLQPPPINASWGVAYGWDFVLREVGFIMAKTKDQRPRTKDQEPKTKDQRPRTKDRRDLRLKIGEGPGGDGERLRWVSGSADL